MTLKELTIEAARRGLRVDPYGTAYVSLMKGNTFIRGFSMVNNNILQFPKDAENYWRWYDAHLSHISAVKPVDNED